MMRFSSAVAICVSCLSFWLPVQCGAHGQQARDRAAAVVKSHRPADVSNAVPQLAFNRFTLSNGLTVIHLEDHSNHIVNVQVWYRVGSRNEPKGRSGFAHLFEHLMFNGSEHADDDWFKEMLKVGASEVNGNTTEDRTKYFQTVPRGALDRTLWLESDRMGYLTQAIDQAKLNEQRKVVENEKRQAANGAFAAVPDHIRAAMLTPEHPYGHSVIGSMDDLEAASLDDVKQWFRDWYGPNNAILVLAGDLTLEEAKEKSSFYFGGIPAGAPVSQPTAWIQKLGTDQREIIQGPAAARQFVRVWNVPGFGNPDVESLNAVAFALAGDRNARLTRRLAFEQNLATEVSVTNTPSGISGQFTISVTLRPDADAAQAEAIIEDELQKLIAAGPTRDELRRGRMKRTRAVADLMESLSAKANLLASGELFKGDPGDWRKSLIRADNMTPDVAAAAAKKWLAAGSYTLKIEPFPQFVAHTDAVDRSTPPMVTAPANEVFPRTTVSRLSSGIEVYVVERHDVPKVTMSMNVRVGIDPDFASRKLGTTGLGLTLISDGTAQRTGVQTTDLLDRLGGNLSFGGDDENATIQATAISGSLDRVLDVWADTIRNPAFRAADLEREKAKKRDRLINSQRNPKNLADTILSQAVWGQGHPYGRWASPETVATVNREDIVAWHKRWFGPNNARIVIVGDTTAAEILPKIEKAFAGWAAAPGHPAEVAPAPRPNTPIVYLVDRPGSVQSIVLAGTAWSPYNVKTDHAEYFFDAIFGGAFTARVNMDLRESKGWSYGVFTEFSEPLGPRLYDIYAPVQTDATKDTIVELKRQIAEITGGKPPTQTELDSVREGALLLQVGRWSMTESIVSDIESIVRRQRSLDELNHISDSLRAVTVDQVTAAGKHLFPDDHQIWVVVGDLSKIEADIRSLNLGEVRVVDANFNRIR